MLVINNANQEMIVQAIANHFFCFLANAIIPKISHKIIIGIQMIAQTIVIERSNQTNESTKLVTASHFFWFFTCVILEN
ncbi:MAG: hypothetical protein BWY04_00992 [candidate division CPR1 bacterium ADurb.Bin160]|jgi:hypothetical protein|uniref:Uncharacterized protein n=1 Tax=candidate division CPR1 bacterium ADurb.Bin160 TaxID=1852826 RepID=A0A1V5ZLY0_9BACT|nr:MAG: hypothetical protein BWY04_00992 [candidate division CPR1 bacterium ADurb.Bin160]